MPPPPPLRQPRALKAIWRDMFFLPDNLQIYAEHPPKGRRRPSLQATRRKNLHVSAFLKKMQYYTVKIHQSSTTFDKKTGFL